MKKEFNKPEVIKTGNVNLESLGITPAEYTMKTRCDNCGNEQTISLPMGKRFGEVKRVCNECGCQTLSKAF